MAGTLILSCLAYICFIVLKVTYEGWIVIEEQEEAFTR